MYFRVKESLRFSRNINIYDIDPKHIYERDFYGVMSVDVRNKKSVYRGRSYSQLDIMNLEPLLTDVEKEFELL